MLDSVCKFIRRHIKKSDPSRSPRDPQEHKSSQGRRNTGRWSNDQPPLLKDYGKKQLPFGNKQRKRTSRRKETEHTSSGSPSGGGLETTYEISMKDMENKKETNIRLKIRRPTGNPNAMKKDLHKFTNSTSDTMDDSREEGEGNVGTQIGGRPLDQQTLLLVVTNVANNQKEDWYPGKERDDISSDNPYFADEKFKGEMNKKPSDSDTVISSDLISDCNEPGAITIGQRLSDVYEPPPRKIKRVLNREDTLERFGSDVYE